MGFFHVSTWCWLIVRKIPSNTLQLRIIHDIDLIPIHLILSKQSIVFHRGKRPICNGASARKMLPKRHDLKFVLVGECNVYSFIHVFCKIYNHYYSYMYLYICINTCFSLLCIFIYIYVLICPDLEIRWYFKNSSSCHHHFSVFPTGNSFPTSKTRHVVLAGQKPPKKIAAKLRATWEEWSACSESCGTRGWELWKPMDVTELTGGWDQPRVTNHQREDIAYAVVVSVCCCFFFYATYIHTYTWSLGCSGESLSRLGFTRMKESRRFLFCSYRWTQQNTSWTWTKKK